MAIPSTFPQWEQSEYFPSWEHDVLPAIGRTKVEIAALAGISRQHQNDILNEKKPISPTVAVRFGMLFGNGPDLWVRMQSAYDTWHAARAIDVSNIPTLKPAA